MTDRDYIVGDLVSYCDMSAIVTFVDSTGRIADIILADNRVVNADTRHLHYLGPGQQYLREAHEMSKLYMLIERLEALKKEQEQDGQHNTNRDAN